MRFLGRAWHPGSSREATAAAAEALELIVTEGLPWLDQMSGPDNALRALLAKDAPLWNLYVVAALLVERPGDRRRAQVARRLQRWQRQLGDTLATSSIEDTESGLITWLIRNLV